MAILGRNVFDFCFYFILAISALDPGVQTVNTPRSNGSERLNWKNAVNVRQTDALLKLEEEMKALEERVEQIEEKSRQGKDKKCVCEHWEEKFKLQMLEKEIQLQRKPGVQVFKRVKKSSGSQNESQNFNAEINGRTSLCAFSSILSRDRGGTGHSQTVVFDNVITNTHNAYNGHTGIFTSPSTGVFAFSWTMNSERSGHYELMHNSEVKTITTSESSVRPHVERASVSATIVLELRENDVVFLRTHHARGQGIFIVSNSLMQSSFSGWQVY
ncbi:uncharacterized protein LOC134254172 [Saccostrea cucullata]|uniref:uncharacterized protein LOC134254172 n=1 Tax=Saccostrea cuccullata TaxID=36930 RepID=UPI002ED04749